MKYFIKKDGFYLSSIFNGFMLPATFGEVNPVIGKVYFYNCESIANDIAKYLDAEVVAIDNENDNH